MKKLKEEDIPLLNRKRVTYLLEHTEKSTPKKEDVKKEIAKDLKVSEDLISVRHIYPHFGVEKAKIIAHVYKSKEDLERFEKINKRKKKHGKEEASKKQETEQEVGKVQS